jgi:hypothetical protein
MESQRKTEKIEIMMTIKMPIIMMIITLKKRNKICLLIDAAIPSDRNVFFRRSPKKNKKQKFKYRNSVNVEHKMFCHTGNHWSHRNCN